MVNPELIQDVVRKRERQHSLAYKIKTYIDMVRSVLSEKYKYTFIARIPGDTATVFFMGDDDVLEAALSVMELRESNLSIKLPETPPKEFSRHGT